MNNAIQAQLGLLQIAEKHDLDIDDVERLFYLKENGFTKDYKKLLEKVKKLKKTEKI